MCGLTGFSGKSKFNRDKMTWLIYENQDRGKDSVGFYSYNKDSKNFSLRKFKGKPEDVLTATDFELPEGNLFIGHVRQATSGKVNVSNAHPFHRGNIVLAMNGTTDNHWDLCREYKVDATKIEVDSDALCAMLNASQTKKPLTEIIGGCAVLYTDTNTNRLYVYRNADRPLYRGTINGDMYISSIENSLKLIACQNIKEFKQDSLYEIFEGTVLNNYPVKRAVEFKKEEMKVSRNSENVYLDEFNDLICKINFARITNRALVGRYLKPVPLYKGFSALANLNPANYYKIIGYVKGHSGKNEWDVILKDDDDYTITISKYAFHQHILLTSVNACGKLICNITYTTGNKSKAGDAGDIVLITKVYPKRDKLNVTNLMNGKDITISDKHMRLLGSVQTNTLMEKHRAEEKSAGKAIKKLLTLGNKDDFPTPDLNNIIKEDNIFQEGPQLMEIPLKEELKLKDFGSVGELADFTLDSILGLVSQLKDSVQGLNFHGVVYDRTMDKNIEDIEEFITNYINTKEKINELENA